MSFFIAITGKGGVGKTTISGLIVKQLIANGCKPVLAIDADPNSCLDAALGVTITKTIGTAREEAREVASKGMAAGISKQQLLEMKIEESLVEAKDFDMISMGRPEGEGCYCYANNVLKSIIGQISASYNYIVLDNEAGLENLSRRIVQKVDVLVMVADPSSQGLKTIQRLHNLANEMKVKYDKLVIIINRIRANKAMPEFSAELKKMTNADIVMGLQQDEQLAVNAENGIALHLLPDDNQVVAGIDKLIRQLLKTEAVGI
jgi:CO dehydrogenase maturation factor